MPRVHHVKKARKDNPVVKKGESYYWWKFRFGGKRYSKTRPERWQLTQSSFYSALWQLEDQYEKQIGEADAIEGLQVIKEELVSELEQLMEECQGSLENMPEHLQETSDSGMQLQERIYGLEEWINELENMDFEFEPVSNDAEELEVALEEKREEMLALNPGIG